MERKKAVYQGLKDIPVYREDTSMTSPDYFQISEFPERLTAGKNLIKLRGNADNLQVNTYVNVEILDYNGDPIYNEFIEYIDEDKYDDNIRDFYITFTNDKIKVFIYFHWSIPYSIAFRKY